MMVAFEHDKGMRFENRLRYDLKVQVFMLQERVSKTLVEKVKILEKVKKAK